LSQNPFNSRKLEEVEDKKGEELIEVAKYMQFELKLS
jgi:hypothetical protein